MKIYPNESSIMHAAIPPVVHRLVVLLHPAASLAQYQDLLAQLAPPAQPGRPENAVQLDPLGRRESRGCRDLKGLVV